ncbi:MAG TPA: ATP-binding protein [Pirellulales bacterium]|nr:ATP-binding protein [Pirellulales bacterium]
MARLTARLASTARLDDIIDTVLGEIVTLGFGAVWMAVLDEPSGNLHTVKEVIDGVDTTHEMPKIFMLDMRQPIGHGFRERRMINITDPDSLYIIDHDDEQVPPGRFALPRVIYDHMRGHPFACGPLLGSQGQPVGALGLSSYRGKQAIPDELFAHGLLRAFMDHLGIAMERARDVAKLERLNADLVRAQATIVADARLKAVGELAAAVAHDLNNLAGVALMALSIAQRSPVDARDALPRVERANRAISDLVARLQRVARTGTLGGPSASVNLVQIIEDVLALMAPVISEHGISVELDLPPAIEVRADPVVVHQIVLNLLLNADHALTAAAVAQPKLRISVVDGEDVRLTVEDNGTGIPEDVLARLFHPFVTTKTGHAGIGLAAAHASLKHFGGQIVARNAPGSGARFEVTLPRSEVVPNAVASGAERPPPIAQPRTARMLIVDDDPDILGVVQAFLEPLGYEITSTIVPEQAIALASAQSFDVVLCDLGMPKLNGFDVSRAMRDHGYRGKIVLMTGWDCATLVADRRFAQCDFVLPKPFLGADLLHALDVVL